MLRVANYEVSTGAVFRKGIAPLTPRNDKPNNLKILQIR